MIPESEVVFFFVMVQPATRAQEGPEEGRPVNFGKGEPRDTQNIFSTHILYI